MGSPSLAGAHPSDMCTQREQHRAAAAQRRQDQLLGRQSKGMCEGHLA